jgi:hypothetical protein
MRLASVHHVRAQLPRCHAEPLAPAKPVPKPLALSQPEPQPLAFPSPEPEPLTQPEQPSALQRLNVPQERGVLVSRPPPCEACPLCSFEAPTGTARALPACGQARPWRPRCAAALL